MSGELDSALTVLILCVGAFTMLVTNILFRLHRTYHDRRKEAEWVKLTAIKRMRPILKDIDNI